MSTLTGGINYDGVATADIPNNVKTIQNIFNNPSLASQLDNLTASTNDVNAPKAHLNYLFFDSKMNLVSGSSGAVQVQGGVAGWQHLTPVPLPNTGGTVCNNCLTPVPGNGGVIIAPPNPGFLVVYIDNQSIGKDVYFDHLEIEHYTSEVLEESHYYPFGLTVGLDQNTNVTKNPYKFNGKELESNFGLETYEYGGRQYDPQLGRWNGIDQLADKYASTSPFAYVLNRPTIAVDPDGKRVYFVAGAGNDPKEQGWNYVNRFANIWQKEGISDFTRVNASHGKMGDMQFVDYYRNGDPNQSMESSVQVQNNDKELKTAVNGINNDLEKRPLEDGEQLNMVGYSYGSVLQEYASIELVKQGTKVDNLVLIGSPTSDGSPLMNTLQGYMKEGKIGNIIRIDIPGDKLSNPKSNLEYLKGIWQGATQGNNAHHFDLARPGAAADNNIKKAGEMLRARGVK